MPDEIETGPTGGSFKPLGGEGAAGGLGANLLQGSIDRLTASTDKLASVMNQANQRMGGNGTAAAGGFFAPMQNPFQSQAQPTGSYSNRAFPGMVMGGTLGSPTTPTGTLGGRPNGSGTPPPLGTGKIAGAAMTAIGGITSALAAYGSSNLQSQVALNTYQYGGQLLMNGGNYTMNQQALARQAVGTAGTAGGGQMLNDLATNTTDASQMYAVLQQMAGAGIVNTTAMGRTAMNATAAFSMFNPAMSGFQSAQAAQQLYNPSTSLNMLMAGLPISALPRAPGTGQMRPMNQVLEGFMGSVYPRGATNGQIAQAMQPGGLLSYELSQYGLDPSTYLQPMEAINSLAMGARGQKRMDPSQINQLIQNLASKNVKTQNAAKATLGRYGINTGAADLTKFKALAGTQEAGIGDTSQGFTAGLNAATRALSDFRTGLYKFLNTFHLSGPTGWGQGFFGGLGSFGGIPGGGAIKDALGGFGLWNLIKTIKGGGGAAGGAAGGGGAAAAGGIGAGISAIAGSAATAGIGLLLGKGLDMGLSKLPGHFGRWMGQTFSPHSIFRDIFEPWKTANANTRGGGAGPVSGTPGAVRPGAKPNTISSSSPTRQALAAVRAAESKLGDPYVWGGTGPNGFDCSGLMMWAYDQAGLHLPRTSEEQWTALRKRSVPFSKLEAGDLVFAEDGAQGQAGPGHVGMMISHNSLIQAPSPGHNIDIIGFNSGYWTHAARPSGSLLGVGTGGTGMGRTGNPAALAALMRSSNTNVTSPNSGMKAGLLGTGDTETMGSVSEKSAAASALTGGISAGSGNYGNPNTSAMQLAQATAIINAMGGGTPAGGAIPKGGLGPAKLRQIENWWMGAGGPGGNIAHIAAAITGAESGFNTKAIQQGQPYATTGWGLWQITPGNSEPQAGINQQLLTGPSNAKAAVAKYRGAGNSFRPWTTYVDGAYLKFMAGGGMAAAGDLTMVGERGPELVRFGRAGNVLDASQSHRLSQMAQAPHTAGMTSGLAYSPLHPVFQGSGGKGSSRGTGPGVVNLTITNMNVNIPQQSGTALTTGASARVVATQICEQLRKMNLYSAIASGANS